ncbi:uncharacterized protein LACBIDRAFT_333746 [Laccaria bicolor S238N-H82]|uniref:Predicted protein n=1 Tax=Laccaria bicolor (strain S238N-H82 / ATCC MYA-4686) TaxID=486041 RepID=B0DWX9_LACBS|nr:uncharacterized protein LACBIDRAFT_333746 [Laccaria bicolor S238N-H82]EDR00838.1 predicted protein [Laccaria bicolor S238N-H82]|eukprot:XP_001888432.1 predicted protein [Laccaria bicolor S238N-H82]
MSPRSHCSKYGGTAIEPSRVQISLPAQSDFAFSTSEHDIDHNADNTEKTKQNERKLHKENLQSNLFILKKLNTLFAMFHEALDAAGSANQSGRVLKLQKRVKAKRREAKECSLATQRMVGTKENGGVRMVGTKERARRTGHARNTGIYAQYKGDRHAPRFTVGKFFLHHEVAYTEKFHSMPETFQMQMDDAYTHPEDFIQVHKHLAEVDLAVISPKLHCGITVKTLHQYGYYMSTYFNITMW